MMENSMTDKLKPCPFCGSKTPDVVVIQNARHGVFCDKCGAMHDDDNVGEDDAIRSWNTRAQESPTDTNKAIALAAISERTYPDGSIGYQLTNEEQAWSEQLFSPEVVSTICKALRYEAPKLSEGFRTLDYKKDIQILRLHVADETEKKRLERLGLLIDALKGVIA